MTRTRRVQESASASAPRSSAYHFYLSYSGLDTRRTFVDHLYTAFAYSGFPPFRDDMLGRGESHELVLHRAIEETRVSIVVFSRNYASSRWCLDELLMILGKRRREDSGHVVLPVFYGVDPSEVRRQRWGYAEAFAGHEERFEGKSNDWNEKLREWRDALEEAANIAGMVLQNQADGRESTFIKTIVKVGIQKVVKVVEDRVTQTLFLSFRGPDTRQTFVNLLYRALSNAGIRTFRDDEGIKKGESIMLELHRAIEESRLSIVVFSRNYASSSWCLNELAMILRKWRNDSGHVVLPVFCGVDPSEVRKQIGDYAEAFARHEERFKGKSNDWKEKLKGWREALEEVANLPGMVLQDQADGFQHRHKLKFIQEIVKVIGDKLRRTVLNVSPYVTGLHSRAERIHSWLQDEGSDVGIVAICGMGGIGKTTIAKFIYNLNFSNFEGSSFLADIRVVSGQQNGLIQLQRQLLSDIVKGRKEKINSVDEGIVKIKEAVGSKRVLIILDDVDKRKQLDAVFEMLNWLSPGIKLIITTRPERLLKLYGCCKVHRVEELGHDESLELFSWHAFGQNHPIDGYLVESQMAIKYCRGLPLAIKTLGSSLSGKSRDEWKSHMQKLKEIPYSEFLEKLKTKL